MGLCRLIYALSFTLDQLKASQLLTCCMLCTCTGGHNFHYLSSLQRQTTQSVLIHCIVITVNVQYFMTFVPKIAWKSLHCIVNSLSYLKRKRGNIHGSTKWVETLIHKVVSHSDVSLSPSLPPCLSFSDGLLPWFNMLRQPNRSR